MTDTATTSEMLSTTRLVLEDAFRTTSPRIKQFDSPDDSPVLEEPDPVPTEVGQLGQRVDDRFDELTRTVSTLAEAVDTLRQTALDADAIVDPTKPWLARLLANRARTAVPTAAPDLTELARELAETRETVAGLAELCTGLAAAVDTLGVLLTGQSLSDVVTDLGVGDVT